jgi:hypothetical protein
LPLANEATITKLQKQLHASQRALTEKSEQFTELEEAKNAEIQPLPENARSAKASLVETYEVALAELTKQCDDPRKDLETVTRALAESEERNRKAKSVVLALRCERVHLQYEVESLTGKSQRDSEVNRAAIRNAELTAQSTTTQKLQDAKAHFENEKCRIFSVAADAFRTFFNAADSIDDRSYRQLLGRVKNELRRLSDSDVVVRGLVGAAPKQSTDDAVARVLNL